MWEQNYRLSFQAKQLHVFLHCLRHLKVCMSITMIVNQNNSLGRKKEFGISGFGISVTTMEEVFIKVGEGSSMSHTKIGALSEEPPVSPYDVSVSHKHSTSSESHPLVNDSESQAGRKIL